MKRYLMMPLFLAAIVLMSGSVWAWNYADHVSQAPGGKGDLLVYPFYYTDEGLTTKIQVVNNSLEMSAVAKVVVRTAPYSQEILDFLIFLTPGDVWEGFLRPMGTGGMTEMYSEDGSTLTSCNPVAFASTVNPFRYDTFIDPCDNFHFPLNERGYVEIYLAHVFPGDTPGTTKASVAQRYFGTGTCETPFPTTGFSPGQIDALAFNTNILSGHLQIFDGLLGDAAALNAVAFKDYRVTEPLGILTETVIGEKSRNSVAEVEAALSKNYIGMPYVFDFNNEGRFTWHGFTFPFKNIRFGANCSWEGGSGNYIGFANGVAYSVVPFDMEENTHHISPPPISPTPPTPAFIMNWEQQWIWPEAAQANPFTKGWYRYSLHDGPTSANTMSGDSITYTGAPVIPYVWDWRYDPITDTYVNSMSLFYGSSSDGTVSGSVGEMPGYQYIRSN